MHFFMCDFHKQLMARGLNKTQQYRKWDDMHWFLFFFFKWVQKIWTDTSLEEFSRGKTLSELFPNHFQKERWFQFF